METAAFILEKVAPVFNRQGYVGTSLSDITKATGLTKGAIYCNFSDKEDLALKAFEVNIQYALAPLYASIAEKKSSVDKLYAITAYHRQYYDRVSERGGCPVLRAGIDTKFINPPLFNKAKKISEGLLKGLTTILEEGIARNELKKGTDAKQHAKTMLTLIEGSSFLAFTHNDKTFMLQAMDYVDAALIATIIKK